MFEPYIESEPAVTNQENTPAESPLPATPVTPAATPAPITQATPPSPVFSPPKPSPAKSFKPSPVKNHSAPLTYKRQMAGKTLKASLLDAFNDAVFGFPSKRRTPAKKVQDTPAPTPPQPLQENSEGNQQTTPGS